ncbi:MAG: C1 family peptidase [Burkholderiaceae bacterium]
MENFGYPIELEDRDALRSSATEAVLLMLGDLPERMDPRSSALGSQGFLQVEDQGQQGSCQGQSLSCCGEFAHAFATGEVIQISRQYAYIASQMENNIRADNGSTLEGGTRAFKKGFPLESVAPYAGNRYPGWGYITQAMRDKAIYKLMSHTEMKSAEHVKQFIGSGVGIVQLGITWGNEMSPDGQGCIRSFSGRGGGGHAIVFAGYVPDSDVGVKSSAGWWLLLKNSWSKRWGKSGYAYVDPKACDQMLRHQWTSMYGRSDMDSPRPRPIKFDFSKQSILG